MCSSKSKPQGSPTASLSHINGRPVLQPNCSNRNTPLLERRNSLKKSLTKSPSLPLMQQPLPSTVTTTTNISPETPKQKSPRQAAVKRGNDPNGLNSSGEKVQTPRTITAKSLVSSLKKSKKTSINGLTSSSSSGGSSSSSSPSSSSSSSPTSSLDNASTSLKYSSSVIVEAPGSIAAARREQVAIMQVQRKMRIAHYGRTKSAKYEGKVLPFDSSAITTSTTVKEEKKCSFITSNSDPIYIAYHDEEWGVPVHDDQLLFELLVLTGAQVGSDWTTVLKKRQDFRDAFSGFDPEIVAKFNEKKMVSICTDYGIDMSQVRGAVDNANRILEVIKINLTC
ncbi:OLC1v1025538C2 [Oldenlandia corymbosa var. corymbosa]|uniref:OLC1v1025538C2 n=1 Tax=Oldenlandia corymbosa var. corymbosa TaxID=529605 RepID=A0AAV1C5W5_OLDCO|nr:OLC1v1025538C2 [Oldenlandia corymbosa var. corymbosa]